MSKVEVGHQTEKAVDNAIESMQKNIKFKRVVNFSITVLEETCALAGTNCKRNCEFVSQRKGYKQVINVLQNHASNAELSKKSCIILKQLLKESDDSQLASRMVESQCAEALQLMIETPPEKDDETKQLVLEILNYLFAVKGVLHKIVAKHGKGILKMFMNTDKPDMARAVIECLQHTASEGLEELENKALAKMNLLVKAHQNDIKVCQSGSEYIKSLFENSNPAKIKECAITPRDIMRSFGPYNMDDKIFRNLDVAIDQMGTDEEFYNVLGELLKNPTSDDFWIMSHLVDRASLDIEGKKDQINQIIKLADSKDLVKSLNSEVCFFLKELKRARPELAKELMKDKSSLIKKIMDEIDHISGPYKFIGLKVLQENIEAHGDFMRENDIIKKAEAWMKQCESPEDMKQILDFMGAFCDDKVLKSDMIKANLHKQAIEKCQKNFSGNSPTFVALYSYLNKCIDGEEAINDFCESGSMEQTLTMAASMVDKIEDLEGFMSFSTKVLSKPNAAKKLAGSFESVTKLFCTLFEKRVVDFFNKWFNDRSKKEVWATTYRPNFLESIVTEKERDSLRKSFATYEMSTLAGRLRSIGLGERGMDTVTELAQLMATLVCFIAKDDPESTTTLDNRELIDNSVQSLKNNIEFINEKNLKSHIIGRYMAMFCVLLPLFHQRAYVKKIANKKSEFCYLEFVQFAELGCTRQPIMVFYTMAAYGLYIIPNNLKPERPQIAPEDEEERKEAVAYKEAPWTPLTFILSDNPVSNSIVDILGKWLKKKADPIMPFVGYLSLALVYQFGTQDSDLIIQSQLVDSLIAMINDETLETFLATSAIYSMDCWCDCSEKSIMKLNNLGSYDKLLRFMNNLRNQDILKVVISSLLQKLANLTDGNQLEYDLERLVKKCKDYDDNCIAKGDEMREDALSAYNELSGLLHISKAQQYCLNKNLQSITLNTLAAELRREPDDMVSRGLIVNYQDIIAKLLETNLLLFQNAKSKPDDHKNVTGVLQNVLGKWRSDPVMLKNTLELVKCCAKKKGQLELNAHQSKEMFEDLKSLKAQYKNDQELADKIDSVIELLDLETEKEIEQEAPVIIEPPVDRVQETKEEQKLYDHNVGEHTEQLQEQEQEQKELLEGFVTEGIFAEAQETFENEEEKIVPEEEEKMEETLLDEHDIKETAPETPETQEEELNLREANDRNRLYNALSKKVEDPSDTSQDEFIAKGQQKINELEFDELALAIFYAKWVTKATSIPETTPHVGMPARKLKANLDKFTGQAELLKYTCSASASSSKANQNLLDDVMESDLITSERMYLSTAQPIDITSVVFFGKTVKNCANSEDNKISISQKGVIKVFINTLHNLKAESEGVLKAVLQAVNAICSSKASCPINTEKTEFIDKLVDFGAEMIGNADFMRHVLECFGVMFKFGGEKIRTKAVDVGATEYYSEVFLTYRDDDDIMRHLYSSAGNIGDIASFWKTLDSVALTDFAFSKLSTYPLDIAKPAMICLVLMTKQDNICDKCVFGGLYRWLDHAIKAHNDNVIISFSLVIENALTATMKRQIKLNEERLYDVVMPYHEDVVKSKNEKLLILWLSILCKLTNDEAACESIICALYQTLDALLREHYYNEPVFEKIYNLMTNILTSTCSYVSEIDTLLQLSFHKHSVNSYTENFFLMYINFLEKLTSQSSGNEIGRILDGHKESIMNTLHGVPLLLRNISTHLQKKFDIKFPRKTNPTSVKPYFKTSMDLKTINLLHIGSQCKRYRPGAVIETGMLFMDRQLKHLVFQKDKSLSVLSRDIIFLGDMIKVIKGYDERSSFIEAIKKYNLSLEQDVTLMVLSSKISYGETGYYLEFNNYDARTLWKESLRVLLEEIPKQTTKK